MLSLPLPIEGCLQPAAINMLIEVVAISNPDNILEIGFNSGHSAYYWLTLSNANLISIDIGKYKETALGVDIITKQFPNRFSYIEIDSKKLSKTFKTNYNKFDLIFIDGDHSIEGITNDIELAIEMKIPFIFIDDYCLQVKAVVDTFLTRKIEKIIEYKKVFDKDNKIVRQPAILTKLL